MTLGEWLADQIGPGKRYHSARELALDAGLNQNTVQYIIRKGRAEPETLVKIARVLGMSPLDLFVRAGWLDPAEVGEDDLAARIRRLTPAQRQAVEAIVREFLKG